VQLRVHFSILGKNQRFVVALWLGMIDPPSRGELVRSIATEKPSGLRGGTLPATSSDLNLAWNENFVKAN